MANSLIEDVFNEPINDGGKNKKEPKQKKPKKSKKSLIIIMIIILIIIACVVAAIMILQKQVTEVSNKAKFFEYLGSSNIEEVGEMDSYTELINKLTSEDSSVATNIGIEYKGEDFSISDIELLLDAKNDAKNNKCYIDTTLSYSDNELFNLEILTSSEAIALKSDEVVSSFVGMSYEYILENISNDVEDTLETDFDVSIDNQDYLEDGTESSLDEDEYNQYDEEDAEDSLIEPDTDYNSEINKSDEIDIEGIENIELPVITDESLEMYKGILEKNLDEDNFSSRKVTLSMESGEVQATEYALTMSEEKCIDIVKQILQAFETDTETIDSLSSLLNLFGVTEEDLVDGIDEIITELEDYEPDANKNFVIKVYESEDKTVKLTFEYDEVTMEIEYGYENNKNSIKITSIDNEDETGLSYKITNTKSDLSEEIKFEISEIEESEVAGTITLSMNIVNSNDNYTLTSDIEYKTLDTELNIDITNEIEFTTVKVEDLTDENCVLLEDLTDEQREETLNAIYERLMEVLNDKFSQMDFIDNNTSTTFIEQNNSDDEDDDDIKEIVKQDLISAIQDEMTIAYENGEEYTLEDLYGLEIEGYIVDVQVSNDIATVKVDDYTFNIDSKFNLSE